MSKGRFFCGGSALAVTLVLTMGAPQASAQDNGAAPKKDDSTEVTAIVSTGSYIRGAQEDVAQPIEVTTRQELLDKGTPTVEELTRGMSEIGNIQGEDNRNGGNDPGVSTINLRNMGSGRTLVLLNGQRLPKQSSPATNGDTQDTSVIPVEALQQVEVLKDGGSATYGSEAVAGVVNFRTRRDLNGVEASADYKFIRGSDGDYDGNIQFGRRQDSNNILISLAYNHRSELQSVDRSFTHQPALEQMAPGGPGVNFTGGWTQTSNPGAYSFWSAPGAAAVGVYPAGSLGTATVVRSQLASAGSPTLADNSSSTNLNYGTVRDPLCNQLGGFRGFSISLTQAGSTPVCLTNFLMAENLVQTTDHYGVFADANFEVNDKWSVESSFNFAKTVLPNRVYSGPGGNSNGGAISPCDPYDPYTTQSTNGALNCLAQGQYTGGVAPSTVSQDVFVSGYNPALIQFVTTARTFPAGAAVNSGSLYFSAAQAAQIASCTPGLTMYGGSAATLASCTNIGNDAAGRAQMKVNGNGGSQWTPFGLAGDPAYPGLRATERQENTEILITNTLKGDLGEVFGTSIDLALTGSYTRNFINQSGKGILSDRLQRALNGFATNLNDLSGAGGTVDRCTAGETLGTRVAGGRLVPFTTGNGGGWGDANGAADGTPLNVTTGLSSAGNGCYYFNPFASAVDQTRFGVQLYQNVAGNDSTYGFVGTGQYQGYGTGTYGPSGNLLTSPNSGLANSIGVINWLYENRYRRISQDTVDLTAVLNGTGGFNLPGGPLAWAAGSEYRYYDRFTQYDALSDRQKNPCSFLSNVTGLPFANRVGLPDQNDVNVPGRQALTASSNENYSVSCNNVSNTATGLSDAQRGGPWLDGFGGTETRTTFRTVSGFGELSLPFTDRLNGQLQSRYERARINLSLPVAAVVTDGALKFEVNKMLQLRASLGQTFNATDPNCNTGLQSIVNLAGSSTLITGSNLTPGIANQGTQANTYCNTALGPERGFNYDFGVIFRPSPNLFTTIDLWTIKVTGRAQALTALNMARLLAGEGALGANLINDDFAKILDGSQGTINCATSDLFRKIDPASGLPLVEYVGTGPGNSGIVTPACATGASASATTINGFTGDPGNGAPTGSYALLYNLPNQINAGEQNTRGLDMNITYRIPRPIFGGLTTVDIDSTYLFYLNTAAASYNGVIVGTDGKFRGAVGAPGAQVASTLRGSFGLSWVRGKNRLTGTAHFFSSVLADPASFGTYTVASSTATYTNYNPATVAQQSACTAEAIESLVPNPALQIAGAGVAGLGEGPANPNCNIGDYYGGILPGRVTFDLSYVRQLPGKITLSIAAENLFDTDPPYSRQTQYYFPSTGLTALGRTLKVGVRKAFQ